MHGNSKKGLRYFNIWICSYMKTSYGNYGKHSRIFHLRTQYNLYTYIKCNLCGCYQYQFRKQWEKKWTVASSEGFQRSQAFPYASSLPQRALLWSTTENTEFLLWRHWHVDFHTLRNFIAALRTNPIPYLHVSQKLLCFLNKMLRTL